MSATATAGLDPTAVDPQATTGLKQRLRRAERMKKLKLGALIVPLAVFVFLTFIWPIASLMMRSVHSPEVVEALPRTMAALQQWDGSGLPADAAFQALAEDLSKQDSRTVLARAAKRLNMESPGIRSLVFKTARKMPLAEGTDARSGLVALDKKWGEPATWSLLARNSTPYTAYYLLAAVDHRVADDGSVVASDPDQAIYLQILGRTFWMSFIVTACCLLMGFPLAYLLATQPARISNLLMILVLLPFWTSVLVRVAAWIVLLQNEGLVNGLLQGLGVTDAPLQLVFNRFGVYVAMVHIMLPFMVLPLYSVMKGISPVYVRAAVSLGCPPFASFWKVYFPQSLPGVGAGSLLVFIICMGYYITPALLGGPKEQMASYFVAFYTNQTINWGMAAALSAVLLAATLVLYAVYSRYLGAPAGANQR